MYHYDPSMPKFFFVGSLSVDEVLAEEGSHCCGLIEAHNTIVGAHLFERTKHLSLVAT